MLESTSLIGAKSPSLWKDELLERSLLGEKIRKGRRNAENGRLDALCDLEALYCHDV